MDSTDSFFSICVCGSSNVIKWQSLSPSPASLSLRGPERDETNLINGVIDEGNVP